MIPELQLSDHRDGLDRGKEVLETRGNELEDPASREGEARLKVESPGGGSVRELGGHDSRTDRGTE
jgi:hypothetical protein